MKHTVNLYEMSLTDSLVVRFGHVVLDGYANHHRRYKEKYEFSIFIRDSLELSAFA